MKLRIKGNSIRFRLTRSEVEELNKKGHVEDLVNFGDGVKFIYEIKADLNKNILEPVFKANKISVLVCQDQISQWALTDKVTIKENYINSDGDEVIVMIEKDFKCLSPRDEDESDMFPHPSQK
tara:strand:- start:3436 stop:3804 length:369 start_codon:yes stop_codon:yes gene_type:complete